MTDPEKFTWQLSGNRDCCCPLAPTLLANEPLVWLWTRSKSRPDLISTERFSTCISCSSMLFVRGCHRDEHHLKDKTCWKRYQPEDISHTHVRVTALAASLFGTRSYCCQHGHQYVDGHITDDGRCHLDSGRSCTVQQERRIDYRWHWYCKRSADDDRGMSCF